MSTFVRTLTPRDGPSYKRVLCSSKQRCKECPARVTWQVNASDQTCVDVFENHNHVHGESTRRSLLLSHTPPLPSVEFVSHVLQ